MPQKLAIARAQMVLDESNIAGFTNHTGNRMTDKIMAGRYTAVLVKWKKASSFTFKGKWAFKIDGRSFTAVWTWPLVQRCCCCLKATISGGSSAGASISGINTNCHPRNWARYDKSMSSVSVSCCQ